MRAKKYVPLENKYGVSAIRAYELIQLGYKAEDAWEKATEEKIESISARKKGCPKNAFLGLMGERNNKNAMYALKALELLDMMGNVDLEEIVIKDFWRNTMKMETKSYNYQLHVVFDLRHKGYI